MTIGTLAWSVADAALFVASGLVVAVVVKRAFFATWRSSVAVVAVVMIWLCWGLAIGQLLGAFGWLRRGPLILTALACAGVALALSHCFPASERESQEAVPMAQARPGHRLMVTTTTVLVIIVAAIWTARTIIAVHRGIDDVDSLDYHLPFTVTFAQTGFANQHLWSMPGVPFQFYPANDELLSAIALVLTRSVVFAAIKNLLFGGLVLVAAHAIGKVFRAGTESVAAATLVLGLPVIAFSQPGEAVNDSLVLLSLLAALAFLAHGGDRPAPYVLAMACAGVALGDKFSAVVPAMAVAVFALWLFFIRVSTHRVRWTGAGALGAAVTGGSWYLRNALTYGNPVPPARLGIGPLHLRQIATASGPGAVTVLSFLIRGRALGVFARGAPQALGPLVPVVAALCVFGLVAGMKSRGHYRRGLSLVALVCAIGYLATPASAWDVASGNPLLFEVNLHYAAPALLVLMVSAGIALSSWRWVWLLPVLGCAVALTGIVPGRRLAPLEPGMGGPGFGVLLVAALCGGAVAWTMAEPTRRRWTTVAALATVVFVLAGSGLIADRYSRLSSSNPVERWAASVSGVRVAAWILYPAWLYGPGATNKVVVFERQVDGAPVTQNSCQAWMEDVVRGHFQFTAVITGTYWYRWQASDPAFRLEATAPGAAVFKVVGKPDTHCGAHTK